MDAAVPEAAIRRFGNPKAHPRVTAVYSARSGWVSIDKGVITDALTEALISDGYTMVELRWHFTSKRLKLSSLKQHRD